MNAKKTLEEQPLRIGISTRALFDLEKEHAVFEEKGVQAYARHQHEREKETIAKGCGFNVIERLLGLNKHESEPLVEVILLSRNSPDLSLRAFNSIEKYGLTIKTGTFTSGRSLGPYVPAWDLDLFLSNDTSDVRAAVAAGTAAAKLGPTPQEQTVDNHDDEVRIALDGDAVLFSPESDKIYKDQGLAAFLKHEKRNAKNPMEEGPFGKFFKRLSLLRDVHMNDAGLSKVRLAIVTARNTPAHERVIHTLRAWGTAADEVHFVGKRPKASILKAFGAHIFFDDQEKHVLGAAEVVSSGHVPGPHDPEHLILPAN